MAWFFKVPNEPILYIRAAGHPFAKVVPPPPIAQPVSPPPSALPVQPLYRNERGQLTTIPPPGGTIAPVPAGYRDASGQFRPFGQPPPTAQPVPQGIPVPQPPQAIPLPGPGPRPLPNPNQSVGPILTQQQQDDKFRERLNASRSKLAAQAQDDDDKGNKAALSLLYSAAGGNPVLTGLSVASTGVRANLDLAEQIRAAAEPIPGVPELIAHQAALLGLYVGAGGRLLPAGITTTGSREPLNLFGPATPAKITQEMLRRMRVVHNALVMHDC